MKFNVIVYRCFVLLLAAVMLLSAAACSSKTAANDSTPSPSQPSSAAPVAPAVVQPEQSPAPDISKDREGNPIDLPASIERVIALGPSNNEELIALGCGDKIIAADEYSKNIPELPKGIPLFSMMTPDGEKIIELNPDVIFVTGMSKVGGTDPFQVVKEAGLCVVYIPSSSSIEAIKEDIRYLAAVMGAQANCDKIIADMDREIEAIASVGRSITDKKRVYFEVGAAPYMYATGRGTFIHEMIELIGAENILADQERWVSVADETVLEANPDVILTSVNYIPDPIDEIKSRPGWDKVTAVHNGDVYYIDTDASNRPSHHVVKALKMMAQSVYPDKY